LLGELSRDLQAAAAVIAAAELRLVGGEPLLHPQLHELIQAARRSGIAEKIVLMTNGVLAKIIKPESLEGLDVVVVTVYPSTRSAVDVDLLRGLARRCGFALELRYTPSFRHTLLDTINRDSALVQKIYRTCGLAHVFACHTIHNGRYYKCSPAPFLQDRLDAGGEALRDGVALHDNQSLRQELVDYLACPHPLNACRYCLGTAGKTKRHRQLASVAAPRQDLTPTEKLLATSLDRLVDRLVVRWRRAIEWRWSRHA